MQSSFNRHDALLLAMFVDQENPRNADIPVGARPFLFGRLRGVRSTGYGLFSLVAHILKLSNLPAAGPDQAQSGHNRRLSGRERRTMVK